MTVWVRRVALGLTAAIFIVVAIGYLLPRQVSVTRTVEVAAPPAAVFALVGDLRRFSEWAPWLEGDADVVITFTGPLSGGGQTMEWRSEKPEIGSGRQTVTRVEPDREVEMTVDFGEGDRPTMWIGLEAAGAATAVTWGSRTDLGAGPLAHYLGLRLDARIGPDLERGLAKLKTLAEASPPQPG